MKLAGFISAAAVVIACSAYAQSSSTAPRTTEKPAAVSNPKDVSKTTMAPVGGKNSFTKTQAMNRFKDNGYTGVTGLKKDSESVWHGTGMKDGKKVTVMLDYQGNITTN